MPYDIWCGGCGIHIAQSVRYNAEKSKVGMYYTTPIWKFRMRCHLCPQYFEIKTDPAVSQLSRLCNQQQILSSIATALCTWTFTVADRYHPHVFFVFYVQNHDYVITSGARRKEKRWDPKDNEQIVPDGEQPTDDVVMYMCWCTSLV